MISALARLVLKQKGFTVLEAADGRAGLDLIRAERPCLVLLDLNMPDTDGRAVLRELQAEAYDASYIVVLSGEESDAVDGEVRGLGADESMKKPFNPMELGKKLEALIAAGDV
jgi:two-component system response regulator AdeR